MSELERLSQLYWTAQKTRDKLQSFVIPESAAIELAGELAGSTHPRVTAEQVLADMKAGKVRLMTLPVRVVD